MKIYNKAKWILGILMVFILILSTNLIDKNNFVRVKDSVVAIYEDRLVAKGLIFDMSRDFHEKEIAAIQLDTSFYLKKNKLINSDIEQLIARFKETKLTKQEGIIFTDFEENFALLKESETTLVNSNFSDKIAFNEQISKIKTLLNNLSKVQLDEGKRQMFISKKALDTVELFTQIEIYFLIFLAIVVQVIIMYTPKKD